MGLGDSKAEGSPATAQGDMGCRLVGVISWWLLHPSSPCCRHKSCLGWLEREPLCLGTGRGLGPGSLHFRGWGSGLSPPVRAESWGVARHRLKLSDCFYFHINKTEPKAALI